ncbi:hypothetical protein FGB62_74g17 [Gracilaria domingensis]|nr:hypothetical protein FGB62_74g17 [Gracilaria domingensis]
MVYYGLDWFIAAHHRQPVSDSFVQLNLHRDAKIYLIVPVKSNRDLPTATLPGWTSEGWATRVTEPDDEFIFGVHQKKTRYIPKRAYIFSKDAKGMAVLPSNDWVKRSVSGVEGVGKWFAMIAESDGQPSKMPTQSNSVVDAILPNQRCPDALHDLWVVPEPDVSDEDVNGRMWPTWHPQWDPCYWWYV